VKEEEELTSAHKNNWSSTVKWQSRPSRSRLKVIACKNKSDMKKIFHFPEI
jgi:hypothetical protein